MTGLQQRSRTPPAGRRLCILGCGGHARSVADVALASGFADIVFVDPLARPSERILGFPVMTPAEYTTLQLPIAAFVVGLGDNVARAARFDDLKADWPGGAARVVAADAHIGRDARIGAGSFVGYAAHIGPSAVVGDNVIINTRAIVEHEAVVGAHSHIAVNAVMLGRTRIGERVLLGAGAIVLDGVSVASDVTIGAGAVVVSDIDTPGRYAGVPARRLPHPA
jgi:sugar O-acyltransferase (sialic acid O-acetyltransferase NeuD family)